MSKKKNEYSKGMLFKKTLPYIFKEKKLVIITLVLSLFVAGITTITPLLTKEILDEFIPNKDLDKVWLYLIYYLILT